MKEKKTLLVVRGHKTDDIQGVQDVICQNTLEALIPLIGAKPHVSMLIENSKISKSQAREHCKKRQNTIYVGGTALMWYRLRNTITHNLDYNTGAEQFDIKKPFKYSITTLAHAVDFMIYEHRTKNRLSIVALYGATPYGTTAAVHNYLEMPPLCGTTRLLIGTIHNSITDYSILFSFEEGTL